MAKRTEEYLAMIKATVRLTNAVKNELTPLSQELVARELISVDQGVELRNRNLGAVDRAANLVALVTNKVGQDRKNFYVFVEILTEDRSVYKEILEDLQPIYKTGNHLYNKGARAILTVRQPWYHKRLSREDAESKLGDGGTDSFLVRESTQEAGKLVLSIKSGDKFYHFAIERGVGSYQVEGTDEPFPSLVGLIDHYVQHGLPESDSGELVIFKSPCICDASLVSSTGNSSGPESSSGEEVSTCTSSLPKPDSSSSDYTYVDVSTTNERSIGSESDRTYLEVTANERVAGLTSDVRQQHMAANSPPTNDDSHEYESLDNPEEHILPQTLPPKPQIPLPPVPIDDMPWYWGNVSRVEVAILLQGASGGTFLVRDSTHTHGEYTLTVRKGGDNGVQRIRIINKNRKFGFLNSQNTFNSVQELVQFYTVVPLTEYHPSLDFTLSKPVSRFKVVASHEPTQSGVKLKPHERQETWYCEIDRWQSMKMLEGKPNGTFLCRPASKQTTKGRAIQTHTVDIQYDSLKHLKVYILDGLYGFHDDACTYRTLMDLVLYYSENSLEEHNSTLTTTLKYPVKADIT